MTKRKRKNNNSNNNHNNKSQKRKRNWIENCSESLHRIPSGCITPICCVVTRVELEEESLLPLAPAASEAGDEKEKDVAESGCSERRAEEVTENAKEKERLIAKLTTSQDADASPCKPRLDGEKKVFIPVKRDASSIGPTKWQLRQQKKKPSKQNNRHLPNGDNGDGVINPHPNVPNKYWAQRLRLFSRYDQGIQMDEEMWYSVTPEEIARHVARRINKMVHDCRKESKNKEIVVLDAFCGCGGNAIAFAQKAKVIAVDNDLCRLQMAAHNAKIYGVTNIIFVHADVVDVLKSYNQGVLRNVDETTRDAIPSDNEGYKIGGMELLPRAVDAIFLSPPWGGMGYDVATFDPNSITIESRVDAKSPLRTNGGELFNMAKAASNQDGVIAYFLPRNVDGIALGQIAVACGLDHECFELEQNVVNGKVKTITAYFAKCLTCANDS